jgi:hypothetical protein
MPETKHRKFLWKQLKAFCRYHSLQEIEVEGEVPVSLDLCSFNSKRPDKCTKVICPFWLRGKETIEEGGK